MKVSIEDQLVLETHMRERGALTFEKAQSEAEKNGRGAETLYARRLMREFMLPLVEHLNEFLEKRTPGIQARIKPLLKQCPPDKAMYFALQSVFNSFTMDTTVTQIAARVGRMVEDEVRFSRFQSMHKDYYDEIKKDFKRKGTKDYRFMHRVLTHKANEKVDQWTDWSARERIEIGVKLLDLILVNTDLIRKSQVRQNGKTYTYIQPTEETQSWVNQNTEIQKFMWPDKMPCIIPPDDWTSLHQGGYWSPEMRSSTPLIQWSNKKHRKHLLEHDLTHVMSAVNKLQAVPWEINNEVLTIIKACWAKNLSVGMPESQKLEMPESPFKGRKKSELTEDELKRFLDWKRQTATLHTSERERVAKSYQVSRIIRMANDYGQYESFYYVWTADFRGRLYTTTASFSPQGPDIAKGCIRFHRSKPLGERGWYWLRVHGANRYGFDKATYDERVEWVDSQREAFLAAANDPLGNMEVWSDADKPWQFLAFLFEYRDALALQALGHDIGEFRSHIPVGLDGSCNGLQNFSAMLRDPKGGAATNLIPNSKPNDIYAEVAGVCYEKLCAIPDDQLARQWRVFCERHGKGTVPRGLAKRPVMTLPYGATQQSCTKYIYEFILENDPKFFENGFAAACWLTPLLWKSISEVVVAARVAMDWLQDCAGKAARINRPLTWKTIDGFPVYQGTEKVETYQIKTQLAGRFQLRIGKHTEILDNRKQRSGIAPNFVHSCDAAHLRATIRLAAAKGIHDLALIHDDYGTHACDTDLLHEVLRTTFVGMYSMFDPLQVFRESSSCEHATFCDVPARGNLDITQVLKADYFFG
jgi:DNA-directed RNA polymerase